MENKRSKQIFWLILAVVVSSVIAIYGLMFDSLDETTMVALSYLWSGPLVFSIVGLIASYNGAKGAKPYLYGLIGLIVVPFLLFMFFEIFWEML